METLKEILQLLEEGVPGVGTKNQNLMDKAKKKWEAFVNTFLKEVELSSLSSLIKTVTVTKALGTFSKTEKALTDYTLHNGKNVAASDKAFSDWAYAYVEEHQGENGMSQKDWTVLLEAAIVRAMVATKLAAVVNEKIKFTRFKSDNEKIVSRIKQYLSSLGSEIHTMTLADSIRETSDQIDNENIKKNEFARIINSFSDYDSLMKFNHILRQREWKKAFQSELKGLLQRNPDLPTAMQHAGVLSSSNTITSAALEDFRNWFNSISDAEFRGYMSPTVKSDIKRATADTALDVNAVIKTMFGNTPTGFSKQDAKEILKAYESGKGAKNMDMFIGMVSEYPKQKYARKAIDLYKQLVRLGKISPNDGYVDLRDFYNAINIKKNKFDKAKEKNKSFSNMIHK